MSSVNDNQERLDLFAGLFGEAGDRLRTELARDPGLADELVSFLQGERAAALAANGSRPADDGIATLVGIGEEAGDDLGDAYLPVGVEQYDEVVPSDRISAIADLYYIYQHERLGLFRAVTRLKSLFRSGQLRLSDGEGAFRLYRFDRREVLRFTARDRSAAYLRVFGYGSGPGEPGAQTNGDFHRLFGSFNGEVADFWRDRRIANVIRSNASDPSFGSIAIVRRRAFDLRNNLKFASYGHVNVLRTEVMQLLEEAFRILDSEDIRAQFGSETAWDALEEVLTRYLRERLVTSPRQRMAVSGREILRWLAQPHVLQSDRVLFETALLDVAEHSEEWLTSAESIGVVRERAVSRRTPVFR
jgi:hypothetical protein